MIIGLDVGGTNTDAVLFDAEGLIRTVKVPTDPDDLFNSVLEGLDRIIEGIYPPDIRRIVLSTTLTTNAIIQNKLPPVAMIVSGGPGIDPELFRTGEDYFPVSGSIDHRGREIEPIDIRQIQEIASRLKKKGVRFAGVVGKFSVRNPDHETAIAGILCQSMERVFTGHRISGNLNFPRRIATTHINASVYSIHGKFFSAVKRSLEKKGLKIPMDILKADGGTMSLDASLDYPGQTVLSGPAASVMGSIISAPPEEDVVVLDIGGTTTDMAILVNKSPLLDPLGITIGPFQTLIRSLNTQSIGIGGDSAVRINGAELTIGPDREGPPMAFGGSRPTPTDALIVLDRFKEGNPDRAADGIRTIAAPLGLSVKETASKIFDTACKRILDEIATFVKRINSKPVYTVHELLEGYKVKPRRLLVLGGPAPGYVHRLAELSGHPVDLVPRWEVANAIGAALARTTCEVTLFADTELKTLTAPEEKICRMIDSKYSLTEAIAQSFDLLKEKALLMGASTDDLAAEILEQSQFNMIRGFHSCGKNIRVKVQVKPGLIHQVPKINGPPDK